MNIINFTPSKSNITPFVVEALTKNKEDVCLNFEKGEYHFYEDGSFSGFFAPTNNETGVKKVAFPIIGNKNVTIDGNGSTFVFHQEVFPFIVKKSENVSVKNIVFTTAFPPFALLKIKEKRDDGFLCHIDKATSPYHTENGHLVFELEGRMLSTQNNKLSFHALDRLLITYLFAGDCEETQENLPAKFADTDAICMGEDVFFRYRQNRKASPCVYNEGEVISVNLEERRQRDIIFLEQTKTTTLSNIAIVRGGGMGVVAQLCTDIEISNLSVKPTDSAPVTITADILHFVNCDGKISIHDCDFASSLDDACNIHGNYSLVKNVTENSVIVEYGHFAHSYLEMYFPGDILTVINKSDYSVIGSFKVKNAKFVDECGLVQEIEIDGLSPDISQGMIIESANRMPDIHIYNNRNFEIPNWRLSGKGNIVVENNVYENCFCPVYSFDLAEYWYESGRISNLTVRNNTFINTRFDLGSVVTGVSGFYGEDTPKIHGKITVENNTFDGNTNKHITIFGFKETNINNNTFNGEYK